jgi:flagellar biosynthesis regulator FlaF
MLTGCAGSGSSSSSETRNVPSGTMADVTDTEREKKDDIVITIAAGSYNEPSFFKAIEDYNSADNGYRIEMKNYINMIQNRASIWIAEQS